MSDHTQNGDVITTPAELQRWVERACSDGMNGERMVVLLSFDGNGRVWVGKSHLHNVLANSDRK